MAFTVGKYLHDQVKPKSKEFVMSVNNMIILEGQVANPSRGSKQLLQLEAQLDLTTRAMPVQLYNASDDGVRAAEPFGSCVVTFEDGAVWQEEWRRLQHLVVGQIRSLETLASQGKANRLTKNMAYTLFKNVVDYADRYRGMQSVIISDYEASAEITLSNDEAGIWHTPPHWIDSVAHLAGLIVNGSDASNTADYFYVTSGWESMRFGKPLVAGASYRNYVKMIPSTEKGVWTGDVYILQGETIVGVVGQIKFRQFPRLLMDRFFSPNKGGHAPTETKPTASVVEPARDIQPVPVPKKDVPSVPAAPIAPAAKPVPPHTPAPAPVAEPKVEENALVANIMDLIAAETGIDRSELIDSTQLASIGVDSLMALVLVEKFKAQLQLDINSSLFLECSTIGEFKEWIEENR
jgi:asperthecin polyketide synthase